MAKNYKNWNNQLEFMVTLDDVVIDKNDEIECPFPWESVIKSDLIGPRSKISPPCDIWRIFYKNWLIMIHSLLNRTSMSLSRRLGWENINDWLLSAGWSASVIWYIKDLDRLNLLAIRHVIEKQSKKLRCFLRNVLVKSNRIIWLLCRFNLVKISSFNDCFKK